MGLWCLAPTNDPLFRDGKHSATTTELEEKVCYLEGLQAFGFKIGNRIKEIRKEINSRPCGRA